MIANTHVWPARPRPLDGESLSSWFIRLAAGNGLTAKELYRAALPGSYLYGRDLDRLACHDLLAELSRRTGVPLEDVRKLGFGRWCGSVFQEDNGCPRLPWLPSATRKKGRTAYGQQFCPHCLAEDGVQHLRAEWRLSFVTLCSRHGTVLQDNCGRCGEAVQPIALLRQGERLICPKCQSGLDGLTPLTPVSATDIGFQNALLRAAEDGWVDLPGWGHLHAIAFFQLTRSLLRLLASGTVARALRSHLAIDTQERHSLEQIPLVKDADLLAPERRLQLLRLVGRMLKSWPQRFIDACRAVGASSSDILTDVAEIPFAFWQPVTSCLSAEPRRVNSAEVAEAADFLRRHGHVPTFGSLKSLLGVEAEAARKAAVPARTARGRRRPNGWYLDDVAPEVRAAVCQLAHKEGEHVSGWLERLLRRELHVRGVVVGSSES